MTLFLLSLAMSPAFAAPPVPPPVPEAPQGPEGPGGGELTERDFEAIADELELSSDQRRRVADTVFTARSAAVDLRARAEKSQLELRRLMMAETLDDKAILKAVDAVNAAEGELRRNKIQLMLALNKELTPAQWEELEEIRRARRGRDEAG